MRRLFAICLPVCCVVISVSFLLLSVTSMAKVFPMQPHVKAVETKNVGAQTKTITPTKKASCIRVSFGVHASIVHLSHQIGEQVNNKLWNGIPFDWVAYSRKSVKQIAIATETYEPISRGTVARGLRFLSLSCGCRFVVELKTFAATKEYSSSTFPLSLSLKRLHFGRFARANSTKFPK